MPVHSILMKAALSTSLLLAAGTSLASMASAAPAATPAGIQATALDRRPQSPSEGREAMDSAVAAAVVGALTEQFDGKPVSIRMDHIDVQVSSIRDRIVSGQGRLQIGGDSDWIGFSFSTLYDTSLGDASYPKLTLGGLAKGERQVPNDSLLVHQLDERVVGQLNKEFGQQAVRLQLDRIDTVEAGTRYLRISAGGIADFGREGSTPAQVEALYDRRDKVWLRVNYELGSTANRVGNTMGSDDAVAGG